jgi:Mrp family chromosome partitioning ATPase
MLRSIRNPLSHSCQRQVRNNHPTFPEKARSVVINEDGAGAADTGREKPHEETRAMPGPRNLVRLLKPVIIAAQQGKYVDSNEVCSRFYNCFHYSLLSKEDTAVNMAVGITSASAGEGKTLVASNLAVSLAVANQRETVLVDLNVRAPRLHRIFGTELSPGLVEALNEATIQVSKTQIEHLCLLPAGAIGGSPLMTQYVPVNGERGAGEKSGPAVGLEHIAAFRDVLYSLRQEFEFVIVDLPALQEPRMPLLLVHQLDGILIVVNANKTKHEDIQKLFRHVNKSQILGFILNRVRNDMAL